MIKLFINNQECDILPNTIATTRQSYNFSSGINDRYLGRSNQFTLPRTQNNIQILGRPSVLGSNNRPFEKQYSARIEDGTIVLSGIAIIEESNSEYKVQVIENSKLFFELVDEKLKELDFEASDFTYNTTNYNILKVPTTSVWLWSGHSAHENKKADKTVLDALDSKKITYTRPWFNSRRIIEAIFIKQGWSFDNISPFEEFEASIISSNHERFFVTSYQKTLAETVTPSGTPTDLTNLDVNDFENNVTTASTTITLDDTPTAFRLRGNVSCTSNIIITFQGLSSGGTDEQNQSFLVPKDAESVDITTNSFSTSDASNVITIEISGTGAITFDDTLLYTLIEESDLGAISANNLVGYRVKAHDNLPDITQKELIQNYFVMFGAAFNTDSFSKKLNVFGFDKFNFLNSYDWSDKYIDDTEAIRSINGAYAQTNYLAYNNDDLTFETVGRSSFKIQNENIQLSTTLTNLKFSASNEVVISNGSNYNFLDMPIYGSDPDTPGQDIRLATAGIRIGQYYKDVTDTFTITQFTGLKWDELGVKYYSRLIPSLQRARFVTAFFDLTRLDVVGFDFEKCVYIKKLGGYFLVMNIGDYQAGKPTECNLLKLE